MTVKSIATFLCSIFAGSLILFCLLSNYWVVGSTATRRMNAGLWKECESTYIRKKDSWEDRGCKSNFTYAPNGLHSKRLVVAGLLVTGVACILLAHLFVCVYCCSGHYYFPVTRTVMLLLFSALLIAVGLLIYTAVYFSTSVYFSWSYGAGWSSVALVIITCIILLADK